MQVGVAVGIRRQNGFNFDFVTPVIAKIVHVEKLVACAQIKELELGFSAAFADDFSVTVGSVRIAISLAGDFKFMQMAILPAERSLYALVKLFELGVSWHK